MIELIKRARAFPDRTAVISNGQAYTFQQLLDASASLAAHLLGSEKDLTETRIAFMIPPSFDYVAAQWAIGRAGGIAVPLCTLHPLPSLQYVIEDTDAQILIISQEYRDLLSPLAHERKMRLLLIENLEDKTAQFLPDITLERRAMILYTSGTTSLPKGVVTTHQNIEFQIKTLVKAWEWTQNDHILNILPLHHVHGIINVLSCALWSGACCEFLPKFDAQRVWEKLSNGQLTLFMAVPTIYFKLIAFWETATVEVQQQLSKAVGQLRLMVSGSAALPVPVLEKWKAISGHTLLERYGMTEIGMALSNPYRGERRPGHVGLPLPGVKIRLVDAKGKEVKNIGEPGEIQVKGPNVFKEYWRKPKATEAAFIEGWFRSGDIAVFNEGSFKILGRDSVDIIKSGGYKISALEIEDVLRQHPQIKECAVVGLPDEEWGEIVVASLISSNNNLNFKELKRWLKKLLPSYKIPRKFMIQKELPRNTLGKVTKKALIETFIKLADQQTYDFKKGAMLLVNKPLEWTSFDVVNKIRFALRRMLGIKKIKVGHAGTLDPMATGLLIICTGKFTKKLAEFQGLEKTYTGTIVLGATTPSYDAETDIDQTYPIAHIDKLLLDKTRKQFIGNLEQVPPMYSAIKVKGQALYKKARKGEKVALKARPINIYEFEFIRVELPEIDFQVACSKGTYIRSLAYDFGKLLGSGAYLSKLCRTQIGPYQLKDAWQLNDLVAFIDKYPIADSEDQESV